MRRILYSAALVTTTLLFSACRQPATTMDTPLPTPTISPTLAPSPAIKKDALVIINTDRGPITIKLFPDLAPKTVQNFLSKIQSNHYNGLTFHRVEPGFVIQGGDPLGNGTGGGQIASEINSQPFVLGSVGLARGGNIAVSNDSQFFICLATETCQHLSNQYVNFGQVTSGMEAAGTIKPNDKIISITVQDEK